MTRNFYRVDYKEGKVQKVTKDSEGNNIVEDAKYIEGYLDSITLKELSFGHFLEIHLIDGQTKHTLSLKLFDQKGSVEGNFTENLILKLPSLELNTYYRVQSYRFTPEDSKYEVHGVSIKEVDPESKEVIQKVESAFSYNKKGEEDPQKVPSLEFVKRLGKLSPTAISLENKLNFLIDILETELVRLGGAERKETPEPERPKVDLTNKVSIGVSKTETKEKPKTTVSKARVELKTEESDDEFLTVIDDDDDDLPF